MLAQLLQHLRGAFPPALERHEGDDRLARLRVVPSRGSGFSHSRMRDERALHLDRGDSVAGDVHDVVDAPEQPEVAIVIDPRPVAHEVGVLVAVPVGLAVAVRVAVDAPQHRRPGLPDHQVTAAAGRHHLSLFVVYRGVHGRKGLRRRARLQRRDAGEGRDHDHSGLGLPPGVDDRRPVPSDVFPVPDPRFRVDRLTHRAQHAQRAQIVLLGVFRPPFHMRPDGGRRRVEDVGFVALDYRPPAVLVREIGGALVDDAGRSVTERPEHDIAVPRHPADVGRAPVNGVGLDVEDVVVRRRDADQVAAGRVDDALWLCGGPARVEQVEEVLRVHRLARA